MLKVGDNMAHFYAPCGNPIHKLLKPSFNKEGSFELVVSGEENIQDYIQSFEAGTDLKTLVARYANGDLSALGNGGGMFGDTTLLPGDLRGVYQGLIDAKESYNSLPDKVKDEFGSLGGLLESFANNDLLDRLKDIFGDLGGKGGDKDGGADQSPVDP